MNRNDIEHVYGQLMEATRDEQEAGIKFAEAKADLEKKILLGLSNGSITGKNETERQASALLELKYDHNLKDTLERDYVKKQNLRRLAQIEVDCMRDIIRIEELAKPQ